MRREVELIERNGVLTPEQVDQTLAWARQYSFLSPRLPSEARP
jgi:adenosine deaminase